MSEHKKQIKINLAVFSALFLVSVYRRLSLAFLPGNNLRTYILFAVYVVLILFWCRSIFLRITQKSMRLCLFIEAFIMLFGMTLRFISDTYFQDAMLLTRYFGLWIEATLLPLSLIGFFAAFGLGQADSYRLSGKWYFIILPVLVLTYLTVTDETRHFMFYIIDEEKQPNNIFHPYIGSFLISGFSILLIFLRVLVIFKRNSYQTANRLFKFLVPLFEPALLILFSLSYFFQRLGITDFLASKEIIELYAKIYYIEAISWEFYIFVGLVPVNTCYEDIFTHSTIGMQIISDSGRKILSESADPISDEKLKELNKNGGIYHYADGNELHGYHFPGGLFLWKEDLSKLHNAVEKLNQSAEELTKEEELISEEYKSKKEEARLQAENRIYDNVLKEIQGKLDHMKKLAEEYKESGDPKLLKQLMLFGVYIKRKCNLRLIQEETGEISYEDFLLSVKDLDAMLKLNGIEESFDDSDLTELSEDSYIAAFDHMEMLAERRLMDGK